MLDDDVGIGGKKCVFCVCFVIDPTLPPSKRFFWVLGLDYQFHGLGLHFISISILAKLP